MLMLETMRRRRWFKSRLKEFVVALVLDKGYSEEQVALTAQIDEDTVKRWADKARRKRRRRWYYKGAQAQIRYGSVLDSLERIDWGKGIPGSDAESSDEDEDYGERYW